jgi:hypothetical protein
MRAVVMSAALVAVLVACAPQDPVRYAQISCANQDGLVPGSDEYADCVQFVEENAPSALLAIGGAMLGALRPAPDNLTKRRPTGTHG